MRAIGLRCLVGFVGRGGFIGEAKNVLEDAIKKLPADYATVVRLYDLEGRSGPEVASAMGRSRGAVVMLRARAHDRLAELLGSGSKFFSDSG